MTTKRQNEIINSVPKCKIALDVGCDHGIIGTELLNRKVAEKVIFSDISKNSLKKAEDLCKLQNLTEKSQFFCSNGLQHIDFDVDIAIIAGMGGMEIIDILQSQNTHFVSKFLLQPMKNVDILRKFLKEKNYFIQKDSIIFDSNKFYDIILVDTKIDKQQTLQQRDYLFGITNYLHPTQDFLLFLQTTLQKNEKIMQKIDKNSQRFLELQQQNNIIKETLNNGEDSKLSRN